MAILLIDNYGTVVGDGVADNYTAIQNALNAASPGDEVRGDGKIYSYGTPLIIPDGITFNAINGATLKTHSNLGTPTNTTEYIRAFTTNDFNTSTSINVVKGSYTFTYTGTMNFVVGRIVNVQGGAMPYSNTSSYTYSWYSKVTAHDAGTKTVTMAHPAAWSFTSTSVQQKNVRGNFTFSNWVLDFTERTNGYGVSFQHVTNVNLLNLHVKATVANSNTLRQGIWIYGIDYMVDGCNFDGGRYDNTQTSTAYGINFGGQNATVQNCTGHSWRHVVVGSPGYLYVLNNNFYRGQANDAIIDFHGMTGGEIRGNIVDGTGVGRDVINVRGSNAIVEDNQIFVDNYVDSTSVHGIYLNEYAQENITIRNNKIDIRSPSNYTVKAIQFNGNTIGLPYTNVLIEGNHFRHRIFVSQGVDGFIVRNNWFDHFNSARYSDLHFGSTATIGSYTVEDNVFINPYNNSSNYSINTGGTTPTGTAIVQNNTFYKTDCANLQNQIQGGNMASVTLTNNITYDCNTTPPTIPTIPLTASAPAAPVTLASTNITQTSFQANWNLASGADSYRFDLSSNNFSSLIINNLTVSGTSHSISGLSPETAYQTRIRAVNANGTSANSDTRTTNTLANVSYPIIQENLLTFPEEFDNVIWTKSSGVSVTANNIAAPNNTTTADYVHSTSATSAIRGTAQVFNISESGKATFSIYVKAAEATFVRLQALNATQNENNWFNLSDGTLGTIGSGIVASITPESNGYYRCSITVDVVAGSHTFNIRLGSTNGNNNFALVGGFYLWGAQVNRGDGRATYVPQSTPDTLSAPVATAGTNMEQTSFTANTNSVTNATSYRLDVSTSSDFSTFVTGFNNLTVAGMTQNVTGLIVGNTYYYRWRAVNSTSTSPNSNVITVLLKPATPATPSISNVAYNSITVNLKSSNGSSTYKLYRSSTENGTYTEVASGLSIGDNIDSGLASSTTYWYKSSGINTSGESILSNAISGTTLVPNEQKFKTKNPFKLR